LATPLHRTVAVDRQPLGPVTSATHLSIVARKHFLEPGFYQPARGCASRLPHCLICQSPGASESVISFGICAKTALPEPVIRPERLAAGRRKALSADGSVPELACGTRLTRPNDRLWKCCFCTNAKRNDAFRRPRRLADQAVRQPGGASSGRLVKSRLEKMLPSDD